MSWIAAGVIGAAAIGAIGSNLAANKQASAAQYSADTQAGMFNTVVGNEAPFREAGTADVNYLNYLLGVPGYQGSGPTPAASAGPVGTGGFRAGGGGGGMNGIFGPTLQLGPGATTSPTGAAAGTTGPAFGSLNAPFTASTFQQMSPAYNFQLQQGGQGVLNQDSSSQGAESGAALKDLMSFNQNFANTSFNNAFNQYQTQQNNVFNRLSTLAGMGQSAASNQATGASNFASSIGNQISNVGTAQAGGIVGATNSLTSMSALPWLNAGSSPGTGASLSPGTTMSDGGYILQGYG